VSLRTAIDYVAAVYLLVWVAILVYMWLIGSKVSRIERDIERLERELDARDAAVAEAPAPAQAPVEEAGR
jgi:CcmD family protein